MVIVSDAPPEAGRDSRITRFRWWATGKGDRAIARSAPSTEDGDPRQAAALPVDPGAPQLGVVRLLGADCIPPWLPSHFAQRASSICRDVGKASMRSKEMGDMCVRSVPLPQMTPEGGSHVDRDHEWRLAASIGCT
jgi:hypothetical protein